MSPPSPVDHEAFRLNLLDGSFYVKQLKPDELIPEPILNKLTTPSAELVSITRTDEEISIVGKAEEGDSEAAWKCIKIAGPMDFGTSRSLITRSVRLTLATDVTGVIAGFTAPLKTADVPVFAVSTWFVPYLSELCTYSDRCAGTRTTCLYQLRK